MKINDKKIVCVHILNDYSGSPNVLLSTIQALSDRSIEVDLYTNQYTRGFLCEAPANKNIVFYKWSSNKYITFLNYTYSQASLFFKIIHRYRKVADDTIIYINTIMPFGAALAGKLIGAKIIYHVHETSISPLLLKRILIYIQSRAANLSIYVSDYLLKTEGHSKQKCIRVYNALNTDFMNNVTRVKDLYNNNGKFNVLMPCSLKSYKGIYELLKIASMMKKRDSITFTLVLNASIDETNSFINNNYIPTNMKVFPEQSSMSKFYRNASLLINLSIVDQWIETFGLTVLEGMAYGLPCIVPPRGGPSELIEHNINGYLVDSRENELVVKYIDKIERDTTLWKSMSNTSFERSKKFTANSYSKDISSAITKL